MYIFYNWPVAGAHRPPGPAQAGLRHPGRRLEPGHHAGGAGHRPVPIQGGRFDRYWFMTLIMPLPPLQGAVIVGGNFRGGLYGNFNLLN